MTTAEDTLIELLNRVAASSKSVTLINAAELAQWPDEAVTALKTQKIINKARPASSVVCPGCEEECVRPIQTIPASFGDPALFVVCDKRSDVNRVEISPDLLTQWQTSVDSIARFIADDLSLRFTGKRLDGQALIQIGMATGNKRIQMLCLQCNGELVLKAGSSGIPLAEAIRFSDGRYTLDVHLVRQRVDASTTGDARHTPTTARREVRKLETKAMHEEWRKEYRVLKKKHPNKSDVWYSRQIAKKEIAQNKSSETIRKQMKQ